MSDSREIDYGSDIDSVVDSSSTPIIEPTAVMNVEDEGYIEITDKIQLEDGTFKELDELKEGDVVFVPYNIRMAKKDAVKKIRRKKKKVQEQVIETVPLQEKEIDLVEVAITMGDNYLRDESDVIVHVDLNQKIVQDLNKIFIVNMLVPRRRKGADYESTAILKKRGKEMYNILKTKGRKELEQYIQKFRFDSKISEMNIYFEERVKMVVGRNNVWYPYRTGRKTIQLNRSIVSRLRPENKVNIRLIPIRPYITFDKNVDILDKKMSKDSSARLIVRSSLNDLIQEYEPQSSEDKFDEPLSGGEATLRPFSLDTLLNNPSGSNYKYQIISFEDYSNREFKKYLNKEIINAAKDVSNLDSCSKLTTRQLANHIFYFVDRAYDVRNLSNVDTNTELGAILYNYAQKAPRQNRDTLISFLMNRFESPADSANRLFGQGSQLLLSVKKNRDELVSKISKERRVDEGSVPSLKKQMVQLQTYINSNYDTSSLKKFLNQLNNNQFMYKEIVNIEHALYQSLARHRTRVNPPEDVFADYSPYEYEDVDLENLVNRSIEFYVMTGKNKLYKMFENYLEKTVTDNYLKMYVKATKGEIRKVVGEYTLSEPEDIAKVVYPERFEVDGKKDEYINKYCGRLRNMLTSFIKTIVVKGILSNNKLYEQKMKKFMNTYGMTLTIEYTHSMMQAQQALSNSEKFEKEIVTVPKESKASVFEKYLFEKNDNVKDYLKDAARAIYLLGNENAETLKDKLIAGVYSYERLVTEDIGTLFPEIFTVDDVHFVLENIYGDIRYIMYDLANSSMLVDNPTSRVFHPISYKNYNETPMKDVRTLCSDKNIARHNLILCKHDGEFMCVDREKVAKDLKDGKTPMYPNTSKPLSQSLISKIQKSLAV